ncbi:hypothetical protein B0H13DRAFT_1867136 [Mycena leptocephala]|nr:hypothetical protein B0H13DRAFT_1867136 [Mycena leptocephala]
MVPLAAEETRYAGVMLQDSPICVKLIIGITTTATYSTIEACFIWLFDYLKRPPGDSFEFGPISTANFLLEFGMWVNDAAARRSILGGIIGHRQPCEGLGEKIFVDVIGNAVHSVVLLKHRSPTTASDEESDESGKFKDKENCIGKKLLNTEYIIGTVKYPRLGLQYRSAAALVALLIDGMVLGIPYDLDKTIAEGRRYPQYDPLLGSVPFSATGLLLGDNTGFGLSWII